MFFKATFFLIQFLVGFSFSESSSWRCDYTYNDKAGGYFKYHYIPATWHDARLRCQDEGAVLASPYPLRVHDSLLDLMSYRNSSRPIFTGIHATFSKGDYYTVDGTPLSKIPIKWMENEPNNYNNEEECLIFTSGGLLADRKCNDTYPYFCYRQGKEVEEDINLSPCGTIDPDYEYSNVTGSCYKFHRVPRTWSRAHMACVAEGGHLAIINSQEESKVMKYLWAKNPKETIVANIWKVSAFIGFYDWTEHHDWRTIYGETITEAGFDKFGPNEPNNQESGGEHCGSVFHTGLLNDAPCYFYMTFICEKHPKSLLCEDAEHENWTQSHY